MPGGVAAGMGRPRSLPPKMENCQASVGMAARFGYSLTLSPERYGPRSANLLMMALGILPPMFQLGIDHDVRHVAGGENRAQLLVVRVAVLVLPDDVGADRRVHRRVVGVAALRRRAPERRHDLDGAALAELLRHRGLQVAQDELAGETDRGAVLRRRCPASPRSAPRRREGSSARPCPRSCRPWSRRRTRRRRREAASRRPPRRRRPPWSRGNFSDWERKWRSSASLRQPFMAHSRTPGGGAVGCGV